METLSTNITAPSPCDCILRKAPEPASSFIRFPGLEPGSMPATPFLAERLLWVAGQARDSEKKKQDSAMDQAF